MRHVSLLVLLVPLTSPTLAGCDYSREPLHPLPPSSENAPIPAGARARSGACSVRASRIDLFGRADPWWELQLDDEGRVQSGREWYVRVDNVVGPGPYAGLLHRPVRLAVARDDGGRTVRVTRHREDDDVLFDEESISYRDDGGVARHDYRSGPAREERWSPLQISERRWVEDGVELIEEEHRSADAWGFRRVTSLDHGAIMEWIDDDLDGVADRRARRQWTDDGYVETTEDAAGNLVGRAEVTHADGTGSTYVDLDTDGDGAQDYQAVLTRGPGATVVDLRTFATGGALWSSTTAERTTDGGAVVDEASQLDMFDRPDWAYRRESFADRYRAEVLSTSDLLAFEILEVESDCDEVHPQTVVPAFRHHHPFGGGDILRALAFLDVNVDEPAPVLNGWRFWVGSRTPAVE